jgi:hypothetical protein
VGDPSNCKSYHHIIHHVRATNKETEREIWESLTLEGSEISTFKNKTKSLICSKCNRRSNLMDFFEANSDVRL